MNLLDRSRTVAASLGLALLCGLGGCAGMPGKPGAANAASAGEISGGLLVVRLTDRLQPPSSVQVEVALEGERSTTTVSARRQQSVPGSYSDYFVALALPPQRYLITAVRDASASGSTASGEPAGLLAKLTLPFEVKAGAPAYLGRLVLGLDAASGSSGIGSQDQFDEDTLFFRSALPALRKVSIRRDVISSASIAGSGALTQARMNQGTRQLSMDALTPDATLGLSRSARDAFTKFLRMKSPRAFAINDADTRSFAYFSGDQSVDRAMRECTRLASGMPCRLLAVDDTLMSSLSCNKPITVSSSRSGVPIDACGVTTAGKSP